MNTTDDTSAHPYHALTPERVLDAVEAAGFRPDGRLIALNSYENRVYQLGIEDEAPVVVKFYRPGRWSDQAIHEEHAFAAELTDAEVPVVAPLPGVGGDALHRHEGFRFAVFPRRGGRWPELDDPEVQFRLGRFLGRLHAVGAIRPFLHRPTLDVESFGVRSARYLIDSGFLPEVYRAPYGAIVNELLTDVAAAYTELGPVQLLRLHGDFHPGNILWTEGGAHLVDLDDARMGPAVQDLWMLLSGERAQREAQLGEIIAGYEEFAEFDRREVQLIEPLRALRLIHYAAWLAQRWTDPAFPFAFPWFNTPKYWEEHLVTLHEQQARLAEPVLRAI